MTAEQFAYWLQGYAELNEAPPSAEQWQAIRDHLALVFDKVTPNWDDQPAMRALRGPPAEPTTARWAYPPGYPSGGVIAIAGDRETRLVC
jgi:hypothetical protein